jgi:transcriptional regulator with XRE-family HTH domain
MPKPPSGNGPWGEGITYWMNRRGMRQADLLRAVVASDGKPISKNTVSDASRGLDVNTDTLRRIAKALDVPLADVLVSPERREHNEARRAMIIEIVERAMHQLDAAITAPTTHHVDAATRAVEEVIEHERATRTVDAIPPSTKPRPRRRKK